MTPPRGADPPRVAVADACSRKHLSVTRGHLDVNRSKTLLVAALGIVLLTAVAAALLPGAIADRDDQLRPGYLDYSQSNVQAGNVTGETVELLVESLIEHERGGPARNVTVVHRAIDDDSGLLVETARSSLGTLDGEREYAPTTPLVVPREGAYEIQTAIYVDGQRRQQGRQTVQGVGTLIPEYARTNVVFGAFSTPMTDIPPIPYFVEDASGDRTTLTLLPFLTNTGDQPEEGLELVVQARQADSNIVADRTVAEIEPIAPGRTAQPSVQVSVPDDYNYELDAMLRRDGVVVGSVSMSASLDPTEEVEDDVTRRDVGLETSDFETDRPRSADSPDDGDRSASDGTSGPGFGPVAALVALLAGGLYTARRSR